MTTTVNRDHFIIPSGNNSSSEIIEIKEVGSIDEASNFRTDASGVQYVMEQHPYHAVVRFEPMNFSYSQQTTTTTISRDNSLKNDSSNSIQADSGKFNSIAKKLKKCTQKAFIFKSNGDEKLSNGKLKSSSSASAVAQLGNLQPMSVPLSASAAASIGVDKNSSSLRETDEEFSADSFHVMNHDDNDIDLRHIYGNCS